MPGPWRGKAARQRDWATPAGRSRSKTISNSDDIIDSRDVIERIAYLHADETDEAEQEELDTLLALQEDAEGYAEDWQHGVTLIRDSYFRDYAIELADDISAIPNNAS